MSYQQEDVIHALIDFLCEGCDQYPECHSEDEDYHDYGSMIGCMHLCLPDTCKAVEAAFDELNEAKNKLRNIGEILEGRL